MLTCEGASKFQYTLCEAGEPRATIRMPTRPARARNAAFGFGEPGYVAIEAAGVAHRVEYETFDPAEGGRRRYRFFLMRGDAEVATATGQPGRPRSWRIEADGVDARLVERSGLSRLRFELVGGASPGEIRETTRLFAIRRRYEIEVPAGDLALRAFVFFIAVNATYR
ncbi:hypothetical protein [Lysobacter xanthus]